MRQFACLLHLRHRAAYEQLRKVFPLPHPASLTKQVCPQPLRVLGEGLCTRHNPCMNNSREPAELQRALPPVLM